MQKAVRRVVRCSHLLPRLSSQVSPADLQEEQRSQQDVADVGVHMVEVRQRAERMSAQEVEVAQVLVTGLVEKLQGT